MNHIHLDFIDLVLALMNVKLVFDQLKASITPTN